MLNICLAALSSPNEEAVFTEMYHQYREQMMRFAMRVLKNYHDAEDAVQEALICLSKNFDSWADRAEKVQKEYIYKTIRSTSIDLYRAKVKDSETVTLAELIDYPAELDIPREYAQNETYRQVLRILQDMPPQYQDVLALYWCCDYKPRQIAEILHRPVASVKSQLHRANTILKQKMGKEIAPHDETGNSSFESGTMDDRTAGNSGV